MQLANTSVAHRTLLNVRAYSSPSVKHIQNRLLVHYADMLAIVGTAEQSSVEDFANVTFVLGLPSTWARISMDETRSRIRSRIEQPGLLCIRRMLKSHRRSVMQRDAELHQISTRLSRTLKVVFDKGHGIVLFASTHGLDSGAEASDGKDDDIADLLGLLHASEMVVRNVALAGAHVEVGGVVEEGENAVGPHARACELNDTLVILCELALGLALERFLSYIGHDIHQDGVARL